MWKWVLLRVPKTFSPLFLYVFLQDMLEKVSFWKNSLVKGLHVYFRKTTLELTQILNIKDELQILVQNNLQYIHYPLYCIIIKVWTFGFFKFDFLWLFLSWLYWKEAESRGLLTLPTYCINLVGRQHPHWPDCFVLSLILGRFHHFLIILS